MPAHSLSVLATKSCLKNHKSIMDVGEAPYHLVRDILLKIEDPKQMRQIEITSPQICGENEEIWLNFIKRDVPNWETKPHIPKNPQSWYKVYRKLVREAEKEIERDAEMLKATMDGIKKESDKHQLVQVQLGGRGSQLSKDVPVIYASCDLRDRTREIHNPNEIHPKENPDLPGRRMQDRSLQGRQIKAPQGKLDKLRKEARAAARFQQPQKPVEKSVWTAKEMKLGVAPKKKTLLTAPRSMIEDYRKPAEWQPHDPTVKAPTVFAPRKRRIEHDDAPLAKQAKTSETEERENRLKAFTNPSRATSQTPTTLRPLPLKASTSTPSASSSRPPQKKTTLPSETISKALAATRTTSPQKTTGRPSSPIAVGPSISRAATSSPGNGGTPPPKRIIKAKAPVDIFMRPTRRPRVS